MPGIGPVPVVKVDKKDGSIVYTYNSINEAAIYTEMLPGSMQARAQNFNGCRGRYMYCVESKYNGIIDFTDKSYRPVLAFPKNNPYIAYWYCDLFDFCNKTASNYDTVRHIMCNKKESRKYILRYVSTTEDIIYLENIGIPVIES